MNSFTIGMIAGVFVGTFIVLISVVVGSKKSAYKELLKEDAYNEVLNENEYYKKSYWEYRDKVDQDYWG